MKKRRQHSGFGWPRAALAAACGALAGGVLLSGSGLRAAQSEPGIIPTVHPTLSPTSAIPAPLQFTADQTSVWRADAEQRMLLTGNVYINVGYRSLRADSAAVWLTPSTESGENTFDVAIYLSGHVEVREGDQKTSTTTVGKELLVTTRIAQSVLLTGTPVSHAEEDSAIVKRGNDIRMELLTRPLAPMQLPQIVITSAEAALQSGWIARGPNNRVIAGPGDVQVVRGPDGGIITATTKPATKPRPNAFISADNPHLQQMGDETVTVLQGAYFFFYGQEGKLPLEFRAQHMVLFSPKEAAASQPADGKLPNEISKDVTGAYMEGDVTVDQGDQLTVKAERIYYDFTSHRAVMLDATLATVDEVRNVPLYMRAAEIRQLARGEFAAKKVTFSTSEFYTPHYHIGASEIYLRDVTPALTGPGGSTESGGAGGEGDPYGLGIGSGSGGGSSAPRTFDFKAKDATINVAGVPIFYWPLLAGDTSKNDIPLRTIRISNSRTYGLSLLTDWDLFALAGQPEPQGVRADLNLDYFGKRGPAAGVQSDWTTDEDHGVLRTYALLDHGTDDLGRDRDDIIPAQEQRGRVTARDQHDFGNGLTMQVEGSYISDPNFLQEFFQREYDTDKEQETSIYLKKQGETDAFTFLGKFNLNDFTSSADQVDDQFSTEKKPEFKYWRLGDSFLDMFTYYSETGVANVQTDITNYTPQQLALLPSFVTTPVSAVPQTTKIRNYYSQLGWTTGDVLRGDTRQEIDMPLQLGDVKVVPYLTGRVTAWDAAFPEGASGNPTRLWGSAGFRSSMQFWHVYDDVESQFFDVHRIRHVIEPQFNAFVTGSNENRDQLQPFDRDVEGITSASGTELAINQKWQTKRGGPDHQRDVDWIVLNVAWSQFYNKDKTDPVTAANPNAAMFFPQQPLRGFYDVSRPDLSQVQNSINIDGTWRIGERVRLLGEASYGISEHQLEQEALGVAVDQNPSLSYFFGNRYVHALATDEWTVAMDYQLTRKYQLIAAESYDFQIQDNILSSITLIRKLPRFNVAITATYNANDADTTLVFTAWPEGFPNTGFGNRAGTARERQ